VTNGPGNAHDWIAVFPSGAADTGYVDWKYLNNTRTAPATGLTNATVTFTMPATAGMYEIRLYANDTYVRVATSPTITVGSPPPPPPSNIVIYAGDISLGSLHGSWTRANDATAAASVKLVTSDTGVANTGNALEAP